MTTRSVRELNREVLKGLKAKERGGSQTTSVNEIEAKLAHVVRANHADGTAKLDAADLTVLRTGELEVHVSDFVRAGAKVAGNVLPPANPARYKTAHATLEPVIGFDMVEGHGMFDVTDLSVWKRECGLPLRGEEFKAKWDRLQSKRQKARIEAMFPAWPRSKNGNLMKGKPLGPKDRPTDVYFKSLKAKLSTLQAEWDLKVNLETVIQANINVETMSRLEEINRLHEESLAEEAATSYVETSLEEGEPSELNFN